TPQGTLNIKRLGQYSSHLSFDHCNALYVVETEAAHTEELFRQIDTLNTLTIGEFSRFIESGGLIELYIVDDSVHFRVNTQLAENAHYQLAAQLIALGVKL